MQNPRTPHALCWACKRPTDSRKRLESGVVQIWKERGPDPTVPWITTRRPRIILGYELCTRLTEAVKA